MFWFIPTTHRVVIVALLVVALVAFVLFWVTFVVARRRGRRAELALAAHAAIRHGVRTPDPPPATPRDG